MIAWREADPFQQVTTSNKYVLLMVPVNMTEEPEFSNGSALSH